VSLAFVLKLLQRIHGLESSQVESGIKGEVETNDSEKGKVSETLVVGFFSIMTWLIPREDYNASLQ
jgi:hypothetical protein